MSRGMTITAGIDAQTQAERRSYDTDLSDGQWALIAPLIPKAEPSGRPRKASTRELVDASPLDRREDVRLDHQEPLLRSRLRAAHDRRRDPHRHRRNCNPHPALAITENRVLKHALRCISVEDCSLVKK